MFALAAGDQVIAEKVAERVDEGVAVRAARDSMEVGIGPLTDSGPAAMARAVNAVRVRGTTTATRRLTGMVMATIIVISGIDTG
ncbi:MAG: hypothetical protein IIC02_04815 [Planctomycetes bacterium]|nr:hypothetical protein [Planctomycetota bacterium]